MVRIVMQVKMAYAYALDESDHQCLRANLQKFHTNFIFTLALCWSFSASGHIDSLWFALFNKLEESGSVFLELVSKEIKMKKKT